MSNAKVVSNCDPKLVIDFLADNLSKEAEAALTEHLSYCANCRDTLQAAAGSRADWSDVENNLKDQSDDLVLLGNSSDSSISSIGGDCGQPNLLQIKHVLSMLQPSDDPNSLGRIGGYEVLGVIGAGGMGVVLKATEKSLDRTVAIKVLSPHLSSSGSARRRFAREARAAAAVLHPNVIAIHGVSNDETLPYLVMPYIPGGSLQKRLNEQGPLEPIEILRISHQIAAGLAAANAQGLVHRDIKPANVLLQKGVERITITDFGLARAVDDASMTRTGVIAGTPQFMSPEQARGETIDGRSDLFSLGSVMYTMCTGHSPFRADTSYGVLRRIIDDQPRDICEINSTVPRWLANVVELLHQKSPDERVQSAALLEQILKQCIAHWEQPTKQPLPDELQKRKTNTRLPWLIASIVLIAFVLLWQMPTINQVATLLTEPDTTVRVSQMQDVVGDSSHQATNTAQDESHPAESPIPENTTDPQSIKPLSNFDVGDASVDQKAVERWDLRLDECFAIALQNTPFIALVSDKASSDGTAVRCFSLDQQVSTAKFERRVRNLVYDVEVAYWNLFVSYREVDTASAAVNHALAVATQARKNLEIGRCTRQEVAQATEQLFQFRGMLEAAWTGSKNPNENAVGLDAREQALRELLGLASADDRLIRPSDEPKTTVSYLDWDAARVTMLTSSPELRLSKSRIEKNELELALAKTAIDPQADLLLRYTEAGNPVDEASAAPANEQSDIDVTPPTISARRDLARIRGMSLRLARDKSFVDEQSRTMMSSLSDAIARSATHYQLLVANSRRCDAAEQEVEARLGEFSTGRAPINVLLQSQQRRAQAQVDYYRAVADYNKSLSLIKTLTGTLLASNQIHLHETRWRVRSSD